MIFIYEKRLIIFKKWLHIIFISESLIVAEFCFESNTENFTTCSECDLKLNNWKFKRNSMKTHMRQSLKCSFVQSLNKNETSSSTSTKSVSINYIAFSSQIFYLIIVDLYRKQKILFVKTEKNVKTFMTSYEKRLISYKNWFHNKFSADDMIAIEFCYKLNIKDIVTCSKCDMKLFKWFIDANFLTIHLKARNCSLTQALNDTIVAQKTIEQKTIAARKQNSKIKFRNFSESFKSEKFTINFNSNSISIESELDIVIQSDVLFVANSIFISISENSKLNFSRSISFCSTSTILLINQSNRSLVVNIMFFVNYDKRLTTFKKWLYTNFTSETLIQAKFRHTFTKLSLNCITCRRCDVILLDWKFHDDFIKKHFRRNSECFKAKTVKQVVIETIKSEIINFKNINFFDFIMQVDL